ncbi:Hemolysin-type calcium-binding region [Pseudomonas marginalis]
MLDRAGDTDGDVQLWRNDLAGLADLHVVGYEACVDGRAGGADRSAELVGQGVQVLEVVTVLHAAAAGNDDLGSGQLRTVRLGQLFADKAGGASVVGRGNSFNGSRATFSGNRVETGGTHGDDFDGSGRLHGGNRVTGVDRALEGVGAFYRDDLGDLVNVQLRGNAWQDVFAVGSGGSQDVAVASAQLCYQRGDVFRQLVSVSGIVGQQYFAHASHFGCSLSHGASALTGDQYVDVATDFSGSSNSVQGGRGQHLVVVFSDYQDSHF